MKLVKAFPSLVKAFAVILTLAAAPAQAKPFMCVLFPKQCIEPVPMPVQTPVSGQSTPVVPSVPAPRPVEAPPAPAHLDAPSREGNQPKPPVHQRTSTENGAKGNHPAKTLPRVIRPKYKPAPAKARRRAALPSWCARIPAGTTIERVDGAASLFIGRPLSAAERAQARACLKSKKA